MVEFTELFLAQRRRGAERNVQMIAPSVGIRIHRMVEFTELFLAQRRKGAERNVQMIAPSV